jgi:molybdate transport system substrate-binding protein
MGGTSRVLKAVFWLLIVVVPIGCQSAAGDLGENTYRSGEGRGRTLTVFAAASLTDAFREISSEFEENNPGVRVRTNFGSSSALAAQIKQGAPADVFASADEAQMEEVRQSGMLAGEYGTFILNREIVVVPESNPADIKHFEDLSEPGTRLVLAGEEVPAAEYAEKILREAAEDTEYGPGFRRSVLGNVVSRDEDVRAAVNRVLVGDADATFAYASDVTPNIRDEVEVIEIPDKLNILATYPMATLKSAEDKELARKWGEFVLSENSQRVFEEWGFKRATPEGR